MTLSIGIRCAVLAAGMVCLGGVAAESSVPPPDAARLDREAEYARIARMEPEAQENAVLGLSPAEQNAYFDFLENQSQKRKALIDQLRSENKKIEAEIRADAEKMNAAIKNGTYLPATLALLISEYEKALADTNPDTQIRSETVRSAMLATIALAREQLSKKSAAK